ncbi:MAG: asparagine synthase (glutamine-hydrolyzing) [Terriglobia bacterium]
MSGIAGVINSENGLSKFDGLWRALDALSHRGSDDSALLFLSNSGGKISVSEGPDESAGATLTFPNASGRAAEQTFAALAQLSHSTIDRSPPTHRMMRTPDSRMFIVYDGEIFNYVELRKELEALGHTIRSRSDTEVLLLAFQQWGAECLGKLIGMFSFAVLDVARRRLFLARDFFGIKPLYYSCGQGFAFASQVGALLETVDLKRRIHPEHLYEYLVHGTTDFGAETLFADVYQLPSGHYMEISLDQPAGGKPVCYWRLPLDRRSELTFEKAAEQLRELILNSVKLHLRGDVLVGATLSGGIDSSSIVSVMRHLQGDTAAVHTFTFVASVGGQRMEWSEEPWADMAGRAARAVMHKVEMSPERICDQLEQMVFLQDAPFSSPVLFAHRQVYQAAQEAGIGALLSGQGPDALFAGGQFHISWRAASLFRQGRPLAAIALLRNAIDIQGIPLATGLRQVMGMALPPALRVLARRWLRRPVAPAWVNIEWFKNRGVILDEPPTSHGQDLLRSALYEDMVKSNLPAALRFEDRNSAPLSITARLPFLTPAIVEFAFSMPEEFLISGQGMTKAILRRAMRGLVPDAILDRRDRVGFPVPALEWLMTLRPWVDKILSEGPGIPALKFGQVRREWEVVSSGGRASLASTFLIWRWIFLIAWARRFQVVFD